MWNTRAIRCVYTPDENIKHFSVYEQWLHESLIISTRHFLYDIAVVKQRHERWETADEVTAIVLVTNGHENETFIRLSVFTVLLWMFNTSCIYKYIYVA